MEGNNKYTSGTSYLVDYAIEYLGAEVIGVEKLTEKRPPFPCLTGVSNTSDSYKIDKNIYPNILAFGVDTLELNFGVSEYKKPDKFIELNEAKKEAVSAGYKSRLGVPIVWFDQDFMVQARGSTGGYTFLLKNGDIEIQTMPDVRGGKPSPELRVIFRSPYLWCMGEVPAYNQVIEYLNQWCFIEYCNVSRVDMCVDMVMLLPAINRKNQVVTLLRDKSLFYGVDFQRGQRETGYQFGRGNTACRFYDKTYEIAMKGNEHMLTVWTENGWDGKSPVSRLEFQLRRESLRRFDKKMDFVTFQDRKADIWAYMTDKHIRIIEPGSATRKERAKVTEYWKDFQDCHILFGERRGILPYTQLNTDWKSLLKQANGCKASAWAMLAAEVGDNNATQILEKECGHNIPTRIIEAGLQRKARFAHLS